MGILSFTYGTNAFLNNNYLDKTNEFMVDMLQDQELRNPLSRYFFHNKSIPFQLIKFVLYKLHLFQWDTLVYERKYSNRKKLRAAKQYIEECKSKSDYVIAYLHFGGQSWKFPFHPGYNRMAGRPDGGVFDRSYNGDL